MFTSDAYIQIPGNQVMWGYISPEIHSLHQMHTFISPAQREDCRVITAVKCLVYVRCIRSNTVAYPRERRIGVLYKPEIQSLHQKPIYLYMFNYRSLPPGHRVMWGYTSPGISCSHQMHTFKKLTPGNQVIWGYTSPEIHSLHQMYTFK
jgi:hypothetical protein